MRLTSGEDIVGTFSRASASSLTVTVGGQSQEIPANDSTTGGPAPGRKQSHARSADWRANWRPLREQQLLSRGYFFLPTWDGAPAFVRRVGLGGRCYRRWGRSAHRLEGLATCAGVPHTAVVHRRRRARRCRRTDSRRCTGAVDTRAPVASLGALSSRVLPFETIYVRRASGDEIAGNFSRASEAVADGGSRRTHARHPGKRRATGVAARREPGSQGMLFGFLTGAAVTNIATFIQFGSAFGRGGILPATVVGGGAGLMWGALIGAFVHERPLVYRAAAPTVRVMPVLTPDRIGVMGSVQF